ncbi:MAG: RagB/SusD family nutrient uptake outer membrane protein [Dysgonamonadaceae bacterium]|jgi:hypothetical protein|nr:RagB/SusD family nutrient uptake outer membrane protein [Dysgonamonadaceae bacterium]
MKTMIITYRLLPVLIALATLCACSEDWLKPEPLSFYTPENTYVEAGGFYSALTACERSMRLEYYGSGAPIKTEMIQADICVSGMTDKAGPEMDMDNTLLPDRTLNSPNYTQSGWYWVEGYRAIKYANVVIARIDNATYTSEAERNAVLGSAYFQRAYRYYKLTHQYGDVPYLDWEINEPKYDFYTYDRWSILEKLQSELEFAWQWVPETVDRGRTSKAACGVLLMKVCMALGNFDRAIQVGNEITAKHPLMTERFTPNRTKPRTNLMHDLHSVEAKLDMSNTEGLMYVVAYPGVDGSSKSNIPRNCVPFWNSGNVRTPDGQPGTSMSPDPGETDPEMDPNRTYGRGIGHIRSTNYLQYTIWRPDKEANDLRGVYNRDSWRAVSDLRYNNPALKTNGNEWYGKNIVKPASMSVEDTIRCWYQWPHYKTFVPDPLAQQWDGGETPWYIYRTAEVYLMQAECYYWKDQPQQAADAMNVVRRRAGAEPLTAADINIGEILDERARELYYEENRHVELVRISYLFAKTGRSCEVFGGRVYRLDNLSGPGGTGSNVKQEGINFWYDWVMEKNNFYNKGVKHRWAEYKISVHHILWPVPASAINTNLKGVINQNIGYPGAENNQPPLIVPKEGTVLGSK